MPAAEHAPKEHFVDQLSRRIYRRIYRRTTAVTVTLVVTTAPALAVAGARFTG